MKICIQCCSTNIKKTKDSYTCSVCGYAKRQIVAVVEDNYNSNYGFGFKKSSAFVTEKIQRGFGKTTSNQVNTGRWKQYIKQFQKILKQSVDNYDKIYDHNNELVAVVKSLWLSYLQKWRNLKSPIPRMFSTKYKQGQQQQVKNQQKMYQTQQIESAIGQQIPQNEDNYEILSNDNQQDINIFSDERLQNLENEILTLEQTENKGHKGIRGQFQRIKYLSNVYLKRNKKKYFEHLDKLQNWSTKLMKMTAHYYVLTIFTYSTEFNLRKKIMEIKEQKKYISIKWLKKQLDKRNCQYQYFKKNDLIHYLFLYDMVFSLRKQRRINAKLIDFIQKIKISKKNSNFLNCAISSFSHLLQPYKQQTKQEGDFPPLISYALIYSFMHIGLLLTRNTLYIHQLIMNFQILSEDQTLLSQILEIEEVPSQKKVKRISTKLFQILNIKVPFSNSHLWQQKILKQLNLSVLEKQFRLLHSILAFKKQNIINQDIQNLSVFIILLKLCLGLDDNQMIWEIDLDGLQEKYHLQHNQIYNNISRFLNCKYRLVPYINKIHLKQIIKKLNKKQKELNKFKVRQVSKIQDIKLINSQNLEDLLNYLEKFYNKDKNCQHSRQLYKDSINFLPKNQSIQEEYQNIYLMNLRQYNKSVVKLKESLQYQIPKRFRDNRGIQQIQKNINIKELPLPSNNYQIIYRYKSIYKSIQKYEIFLVMDLICKGRCSITELWNKIEQLERELVKFEADNF